VVFLTTDRRRWIFLGAVVLAFATLMAYRLWAATALDAPGPPRW
jgi:type VI protein secretion system component VasK